MAIPLLHLTAAAALAAPFHAQWDPAGGEWGKDEPDALRVMTYNVEDGICRTNDKDVATNNWAALVRVVAAMQPDVLVLQEAGDNVGNGTGSDIDSTIELTNTLGMFLHGGSDIYEGGTVTEYVQKYAPGYDLPFLFASADDDGFNRNVIMSAFPFQDLNGDGKATLSNIPTVLQHLYVDAGGVPSPRGTPFAEIDLPDGTYGLDLVVACSHLKAGGSSSDKAKRIAAGQKLAYYIDFLLHGGGTGSPDPHSKVQDSPSATTVINDLAAVVHAGDFNDFIFPSEDGTRWCAWAENVDGIGSPDGPDGDRSDLGLDDARDFFTGSGATQGSNKLDRVLYTDSLLAIDNEFVFNSASIPTGAMPPEVSGFFSPFSLSTIASDHRPVMVDFVFPVLDCDGDGTPDIEEADFDGDGTIDDCDNCPLPNPDQADLDGDGIGDACEDSLCHPSFGSGSMQLSFCGDAFSTTGLAIFGPLSAPGFIIVSATQLPVPIPLVPGPDSLLIPASVLIPFTTGSTIFGTALPGPILGGAGPSFLKWNVQVAAFDATSGLIFASNGVEVTVIQ